jgi:spore maturation protein CgeB
VYDALASGAFIVSEAIAGLDTEFDGSVAVYRDRADLHRLVDHYLADPEERRTRALAGRKAVLARHTFEHRVAAIIDAFESFERGSADPAG